ncbi:MAG: pyridoxamine 5'-phosphate oxidase [Sphingobacteriales bacterium]|nr:MAG: pyridoxamine 5'-phosphate oxidase [Sphingobacteriales bacterium]
MKKSLKEVAHLRKNYSTAGLNEESVKSNPFEQFEIWFEEALQEDFIEHNAMFLATATPNGIPSIRTVLLKGFSEQGLIFFTNYHSRKGNELTQNPEAAILFYWDKLERQVRIEGKAERLSESESEEYFNTRPYGSRIGALASPQSQVIASRQQLEEKVKALTEQYDENAVIPRPEYWGGYRIIPQVFEFWQGQTNRLHDRIRYTLQPSGNWLIERLAP